jgi:carboxyl-terminal processing protease
MRKLGRCHALALVCLATASCALRRPPEVAHAIAHSDSLIADAAREPARRHRLLEDAVGAWEHGAFAIFRSGWLSSGRAEARARYALAASLAASGDTARALAQLDALLLRGGHRALLDSLETSPDWATLRSHPTIATVLAQLRQARARQGHVAFRAPFAAVLPVQDRVAALSLVWSAIRTGAIGLDAVSHAEWDSLYLAAVPVVVANDSTAALYRQLERLTAVLADDHVDIVLPAELARNAVTPPMQVLWLDEGLVVERVRSATVAALGVRAGQVIVTIDGRSPTEVHARDIAGRHTNGAPTAASVDTKGWRLLAGPRGTEVLLGLTEQGKTDTQFVRVQRGGYQDVARDPPVEARRLDNGIGYLGLHTVSGPDVAARIDSAMQVLGKDLRGLVIDVRRNGGGSQDPLYPLLRRFLASPARFRAQYSVVHMPLAEYRGEAPLRVRMDERILMPDRAHPLRIPVAWLMGPRTASAAEGLTRVVREAGIATLFGESTYGSNGQPVLVPLPGAGQLRMRVEEERLADGTTYTGRGLSPDVRIPITRQDLADGRDRTLEAALAWIRGGTPPDR